MNYKKISKLVKDSRELIIFNDEREQWIGDGSAAYPVLGMPHMNENEMLIFLGLYDQADKISVRSNVLPDWIKDITYEGNFEVELGTSIIEAGGVCRVYYTEQGAVVLKNKYFEPVEHKVDEDIITYQLIGEKLQSIAVFLGFDLAAVILPLSNEPLVKKYARLADMLRIGSHEAESIT